MGRAIRILATGGPDAMRWEEVPEPSPGPGEALVRHTAIGVNFIDTYHRSGLYPLTLPSGIGAEAAGVVEAVGEGVTAVRSGDRVAYAGGPPGAYAERRAVQADRLVPLPPEVGDETAAAGLLKGLTAQYLLRRTYRVQPGDTILVHAAAGGVGLIMCQWAKHLGATVIGTVSTDEKASVARSYGCDHPVVTPRESFAEKVRAVTGGTGVPVVYDSIGAATWRESLECLRPLGLAVFFGNASGPVPPISPLLLAERGSLFMTRPSLVHYTTPREALLAGASELFEALTSNSVAVPIHLRLPLAEAVAAHRALESRATTGSTILLP